MHPYPRVCTYIFDIDLRFVRIDIDISHSTDWLRGLRFDCVRIIRAECALNRKYTHTHTHTHTINTHSCQSQRVSHAVRVSPRNPETTTDFPPHPQPATPRPMRPSPHTHTLVRSHYPQPACICALRPCDVLSAGLLKLR